MGVIIEAFTENPMLLVAATVFLICVVIGFFGDRYLRSQGKIGKILENDKGEKEEITKESQKADELTETNPTLITSENVNNVNLDTQTTIPVLETEVPYQSINGVATSTDTNTIVDNSPLNNSFVTPQENVSVINQQVDIANNVVTNPLNTQSQEISEPIVPEIYPAENNPQDTLDTSVPFDGQIVSDENINNIF